MGFSIDGTAPCAATWWGGEMTGWAARGAGYMRSYGTMALSVTPVDSEDAAGRACWEVLRDGKILAAGVAATLSKARQQAESEAKRLTLESL